MRSASRRSAWRASTPIRAESVVIVFARAPLAGRVKTRLVPRLGAAGAARLQERLIRAALRSAGGSVELHVAGGSELAGMYTDSHAGPVAQTVWDLLPGVVAACPNLCAVTFEFHEGWYETMGAEGVLREVRMARDVWERHR